MNKIFTFENLKESAQSWALEQVNTKHPVQSREATLSELLALYEYNRFGDIIADESELSEQDNIRYDEDEQNFRDRDTEEEYEGLDPEYYNDI